MKLYEIPRESILYADFDDGSTYIIFKRLDGMYSVCITEKGTLLHLSASIELEPISPTEYIIISTKL